MTRNEIEKKIEKIKTIIKHNGFTLDENNHWNNKRYRVVIKSVNVRIETVRVLKDKNNDGKIWVSIHTEPIKFVNLNELNLQLNKLNKKEVIE